MRVNERRYKSVGGKKKEKQRVMMVMEGGDKWR
jgi:hypothetical protein